MPLVSPSSLRCTALAWVIACGGLLAQQSAAAVSSWSGIYTEAQATRGASLYADNCAQCHRPDLSGGDLAPPLTGPAFFFKWNNRTVADLLDYQASTMPLNSPGGLSLAQNADLIAFLLKQGAFPAGSKDLPSAVRDLAQVKLLAAKP
jgi:mono/diheme cytochrome c family protein